MIAYYIGLLGRRSDQFLVKNRTFCVKLGSHDLICGLLCRCSGICKCLKLLVVVAHWRILYRVPSYILPSFFYHILYLLFL